MAVASEDEYVEVDGLPFDTPGWSHENLGAIYNSPGVRGGGTALAQREGEKAGARIVGPKSLPIELLVFGHSDSDGNATANLLRGLRGNLDELKREMRARGNVGGGTVMLRHVLEDGGVRETPCQAISELTVEQAGETARAGVDLWLPEGVMRDTSVTSDSGLEHAGSVVDSFAAQAGYPSGLTWDGTYFWNADASADTIYKLDTSFNLVDSFAAPGTKPLGLAWDGASLWNVDSIDNTIYELDPADGSTLSSFAHPGSGTAWGLAWDGSNLWIGDSGDVVYEVDTTGTIISQFNSNGPVGLGWDGTDLWIVDHKQDEVRKTQTDGTVLTTFAAPGASGESRGLEADGFNLYISNRGDDLIYKLGQDLSVPNAGTADQLDLLLTLSGDATSTKIENRSWGPATWLNLAVDLANGDVTVDTDELTAEQGTTNVVGSLTHSTDGALPARWLPLLAGVTNTLVVSVNPGATVTPTVEHYQRWL